MAPRSLHYILFACILSIPNLSSAQGKHNTAQQPWTKTVSRVIEWNAPHAAGAHHLKEMNKDSTDFELIAAAVKSKALTAYKPSSPGLTAIMSTTEIDDLFADKRDTQTVEDPISGEEETRVSVVPFNYESVTLYRIMEEWTFYPASGKTDVKITGIAPGLNVYSNTDKFIGTQNLFWLKYEAVKPLIQHYELSHPDYTLAMEVWKDYFTSDIKPGEAK